MQTYTSALVRSLTSRSIALDQFQMLKHKMAYEAQLAMIWLYYMDNFTCKKRLYKKRLSELLLIDTALL